MRQNLALLAVCLGAFAAPVLDADTFSLSPSDIQGAPGQTVGWGFTFTSTSDYAELTGSSFSPAVSFGTYNDYLSGANFVVTSPGLPVNQDWNPFNPYGVGEFAIDSAATPGFGALGTITVYYDLYSVSPNDPNFDPIADLVSTGNQLAAAASIDVVSTPVDIPGPIPIPPTTDTPEPATAGVVMTVVVLFFGVVRRRQVKLGGMYR